MAALIGYLQGNRGGVSRLGSKDSGIGANLQTWHGKIAVWLSADGDFYVDIGPKHGGGRTVLKGNVDKRMCKYYPRKRN